MSSVSAAFVSLLVAVAAALPALPDDVEVEGRTRHGHATNVVHDVNIQHTAPLTPRAPKVATVPVSVVRQGADAFFTIPVTIGSRTFELYIDTDAEEIWALGSKAPADLAVGHTLYPVPSGPCQLSYARIDYADGDWVDGENLRDAVSIGGITAPTMNFKAAYGVSEKSPVRAASIDGSIGLGQEAYNWLDSVRRAGVIDDATIMFDLNAEPGTASSLELGRVDRSKLEGRQMEWIEPLDGRWLIYVSGGLGDCTLDYGASTVVVPDAVARRYYADDQSGQWAYRHVYEDNSVVYFVRCDRDLPPFEVRIDGKYYTVDGNRFRGAPLEGSPIWCRTQLQSAARYSNPQNTCVLGWPWLTNFITAMELYVGPRSGRLLWNFGIGKRRT